MSTASTQPLAVAFVTVDGVDRGKFDVFEDIEISAEVQRHRDGGSTSESLLPMPSTIKPITVSRLYKAERDQALRPLKNRVGIAPVSVSFKDLDANMNPFGAADGPYTGVLSDLVIPGGDSTGTDKRMIKLTFEVS
jgi:hypothetical protein